MRNRTCLLFLPALLLATGCEGKGGSTAQTPPGPTPVDVVIISGQSNGVGCTFSEFIKSSKGVAKYNEYNRGYPDIQIAYDSLTKDFVNNKFEFYSQNSSKDYNFMPTRLGQGNSTNTFGPEIGIAEAMHEKYGNKLFLIKCACGSSNLRDDWARKDSIMYRGLMEFVRIQMGNLEDKGYAPTLKAFCWMQGEGDSYPGFHEVYKDSLELFVSNLREDLNTYTGGKILPFIDAGISDAAIWEYSAQVNAAKRAFAEESELNFFIDTIAAGMHTNQEPVPVDECHYDSESELLLGHLFAEQFEQFLEPVK